MIEPSTIPLFAHRTLAEPEAVADIREQLDAFLAACAVTPAVRERARQCVTETANVILNAYDADGLGVVEVVADIEDDLQVIVADEGEGLRSGVSPDAQGLGLLVVARCADDLTVRERDGRGVEVWMRFLLTE